MNIILTEYSNLFTRDFYLPAGDLRDLKSSYKRAHIIIVTKCDPVISEMKNRRSLKRSILNPVNLFSLQLSCMVKPIILLPKQNYRLDGKAEVLLISGIANPRL
ncbi:MAG: tetraacyldisaccharide 4'-kinase [Bacteroidota bacterium]